MSYGDAEGQGALTGEFEPFPVGMAGAVEGGQGIGKQGGVELAVPPGDGLVVHGFVQDAVVVEGHQILARDSLEQAAGVHQIIVAEA